MTVKRIPRHKVFISCHDQDREYKKRFRQMMGDLVVDVSVDEDDIDDTGLVAAAISREIRDEYIRQASVYHSAYRAMHMAANARGLGDSLQYQRHRLQPKVRSFGHLVA